MDIRNLDLRHLRYFLTVAEELNFTRAAERLHMAQPPLSRQIQELEAMIGAQLFARNRRHVKLTAAGLALREQIKPWLGELPHLLDAANKTALGQGGTFRLGSNSATISLPFVPGLIQSWRAAHPQVQLSFADLLSVEQQDAVAAGKIDAGLMWDTHYRLPHVQCDCVARVPFAAFLHKNHPLVKKRILTVKDIGAYNGITFPRTIGTTMFRDLMALFSEDALSPQSIYEYVDFTMIEAAAAASEGIGLMPAAIPNMRPHELIVKPILGAQKHAVALWLVIPLSGALPTALTFRQLALKKRR